MIRDLIAWAKLKAENKTIHEAKINERISVPITITNKGNKTANWIVFNIIGPDRSRFELYSDFVNVSVEIAPGETKTVYFNYTPKKYGIYTVDYILFNNLTEVDWGFDVYSFAVSKFAGTPSGYIYKGSDVSISIQSAKEVYHYGENVTYEVLLWNKGNEDKNVKVYYYYPMTWKVREEFLKKGVDLSPKWVEVTIPARGMTSFNVTIPTYGMHHLHARLYVDNKWVGDADRTTYTYFINTRWGYENPIEFWIDENAIKREYRAGEELNFTLTLYEKFGDTFNLTIKTIITTRWVGKEVKKFEKNVILNPNELKRVPISFNLDLEAGYYILRVEVYSGNISQSVWYYSKGFGVRKDYCLTDLKVERNEFKQGEIVNVSFTISNLALVDITLPVHVEIKKPWPYRKIKDEILNLTIPANSSKTFIYSYKLPQNASFGGYRVEVYFEGYKDYEKYYRRVYFCVLPPKLVLNESYSEYRAGGILQFNLSNEGGVRTNYSCMITLHNLKEFNQSYNGSLSVGETKTLKFQIPKIKSGKYLILAECQDLTTGKEVRVVKEVDIEGIEANISVSTDKENYFRNEIVRIKTSIKNLGSEFNGTLYTRLKGVSSKGIGYEIFDGFEDGMQDFWCSCGMEVRNGRLEADLGEREKVTGCYLAPYILGDFNITIDYGILDEPTRTQTVLCAYEDSVNWTRIRDLHRGVVLLVNIKKDLYHQTIYCASNFTSGKIRFVRVNDTVSVYRYGNLIGWRLMANYTVKHDVAKDIGVLFFNYENRTITIYIDNFTARGNFIFEESIENEREWKYYDSETCGDITDSEGRYWYEPEFDDSEWDTTFVSRWTKDEFSQNRFYRKTFELKHGPVKAELFFEAEDGIWIYVNGEFVKHEGAECYGVGHASGVVDITEYLRKGNNTIAILVTSGSVGIAGNAESNPGGYLKADLTIYYPISGYYEEFSWFNSTNVKLKENETLELLNQLQVNFSGKVKIHSLLYSELGELIAKARSEFYVYDKNYALSLDTDKDVYKPGEEVFITLTAKNLAPLRDSFTLTLKKDNEIILSESFDLNSGEEKCFTLTTSSQSNFTLKARLNDLEVIEFVEVAEPAINATIIVPDICPRKFNATLLIENIGKVNASLNVNFDGNYSVMLLPSEIFVLTKEFEITENTTLTAEISGDVNTVVEKFVVCGEKVKVNVPDYASFTEGEIAIPYSVSNLGVFDSDFNLTFEIDGLIINKSYHLPANTTINDSLNLNLSKGIYTLVYSTPFERGESSVVVYEPLLNLTIFYDKILNAGDVANITFCIENRGGARAKANVTFKFIDDEFSDSRWVEAGEKENITFEFKVPDDVENGTYRATYTFNGLEGFIEFEIAGNLVEVKAKLDKSSYVEGENATLKIEVTNPTSRTLDLFSRVKFNEYDEIKEFNLPAHSSEILEFSVPISFEGDNRIFYSVYTSTGRALYINSIQVREAKANFTLKTDKDSYTIGETVNIYIDVPRKGNLSIEAPGFVFSQEISSSISLSFKLPKLLTGVYYIIASFEGETISYPIDVYGYSARVAKVSLDKDKLEKGDELLVNMSIEADRDFDGLLKLWITDPKGKVIGERSLYRSFNNGINDVSIRMEVTSNFTGYGSLIYGIYADIDGDWQLLASGLEYFDIKGYFDIPARIPTEIINESGFTVYVTSDKQTKLEIDYQTSVSATLLGLPEINKSNSDMDVGIKYLRITSTSKVDRVKIEVRYSEHEISGIDESTISILYWNGERWVNLIEYKGKQVPNGPFVFDAGRSKGYVFAEVNSFSSFGLGGKLVSPQPTPTPTLTPTPTPTPTPTLMPIRRPAGGGGVVAPPIPFEAKPELAHSESITLPSNLQHEFAIPEELSDVTGVTAVTVKMAERITVSFTISKPIEVAELPPFETYSLFEIVLTEYGTSRLVIPKETHISFKVSKEWMREKCSADQIVLMKYDKKYKKWIELPTEVVGEDERYVYFRAKVKSFSIFAVVAKTIGAPPPTPTPLVPLVSPTLPATPTPTPTLIPAVPKKPIPGFEAIFAIFAVVVLYVLCVLRK